MVVDASWLSSLDLSDQIGNSHGLVTVRACSTRAQAPHKDATVVTALLTKASSLAFWTLVDDHCLGQTCGQAGVRSRQADAGAGGSRAVDTRRRNRSCGPERGKCDRKHGTSVGQALVLYRYATGVSSGGGWRRRIELPFTASRWASWTRRSRIASARVGSPAVSAGCQASTGSWLITSVERTWLRSSMTSSRSLASMTLGDVNRKSSSTRTPILARCARRRT